MPRDFSADDLDARLRLAALLSQQFQHERVIALLQNNLPIAPPAAHGWNLLGNSYAQLGDLDSAERAFRVAVEMAPAARTFQHNLANALLGKCLWPEAQAAAQALLQSDPRDADAWSFLGLSLQAQGKPEEAVLAFHRSHSFAPGPIHASRLLHSLHYANQSPAELLQAHRAWERNYAGHVLPAAPPDHPPRRGGTPLRLGLVAESLTIKPFGFLMLPAIESLDPSQCAVFGYSDSPLRDEFAARFRASATIRDQTVHLSDEALARQIREDQIDILIDLSGHTGKRLLVFARRPAPIQITWLGYVGTTGLSAMDYLLADSFHVRPGEEAHHVESVLRLPADYACYQPPQNAPPVAPFPVQTNGHLTFGCLNNPAKFSPAILNAWAEILRRRPRSQLLLKYHGLEQPAVQLELRRQFDHRGISGDRILIEGRSPHRELLATYSRIDLALDTQPYSGGLTTCEALWMGVPVITSPGPTFASRHSTSHLHNSGLPQFVAADLPAYINLAVEWANRLPELATLRVQVRDRLRASPLMDAPRFATDFLALLHHAVQLKSS